MIRVDSTAMFSECGKYRYTLSRRWLTGEGTVLFVLLNPSTADQVRNDPTVERCERRARRMGFNEMIVANLFAFRSTKPKYMLAAEDPVGPENDKAIVDAAWASHKIVCGWGEHGRHLGRSEAVRKLLSSFELTALKVNESGEPCHPLSLTYELEPVKYER